MPPLPTNRCPGSGRLAAVAQDAYEDVRCPDCGLWLVPVRASVKTLKRAAGGFRKGATVGKVRVHRAAPSTDWSKG